MGDIRIAVNSISDKFAHAFIEVRTQTEIRQIHSQPLGDAFPGGLYSYLGDSTSIFVDKRSPKGSPYNAMSLGSNIPDDVLDGVYAGVLKDAKSHFSKAQYEVPRLADPWSVSIQNPSLTFGGYTES